MRTKKVILFIIFIIGVISLLLLSSFSIRNACEYANSNLEYIKSQTQRAIVADDFNRSKYYAYKALNGIEKTKYNFIDCGCEGTIESLDKTLAHLKTATKAISFEESKKSLHNALKSTEIGMNVLKNYDQDFSSVYGNNMLVLNTKDALLSQNGVIEPHIKPSRQQIHNCLLGFENSLDKVVKEVNCKVAFEFISKTSEEARLTLLNTELSEPKKQYYQRVKTLSDEALSRLGDCSK
ncbi:hypothetical protein KIM67_04250 [Flagellimonas sp. 389]|uniref:hypothetical protein n=1 Tax=Flagellimonas sp. 389 TaxID=2835862 RepID=UPI001BD5A0D1|nr:hypothetical protein [Flagellimonas sp. 389]MBS9461610.1 hypothetical protein [Flagellimonas sp. 389]